VPRFVVPDASGEVAPGAPPTFSVIVAAYQAAATIGDALASALDQRPAPHEVVVCDDGSTDDLAGAVARFGDRVVVVRQENRGEAGAKNTAARHATGEFVVILDADDYFLPGRLAALGELAAARPDLDILTTDAYLEVNGDRAGTSYGPDHRFATDDQRRAILDRNFVFGLAAIRRSRLLEIGGFDERVTHGTDWDCWARLILGGSRAGLVDEPLAVYRLHESAANADRVAMARGRLRVLRNRRLEPSLTDDERRFLRDRIAQEERRVEWEELRASLANGASPGGVRSVAWRVVRDRGQPRDVRARGALALAVPALARRRIARNAATTWTTAGDRRVARSSPNGE
jgi:glycosyltransferase involved in cell wall biosynthesis